MLHSQLAALALAATTLAASGCGGSSKIGSSSASVAASTTTATTTTTTTTTAASGKPVTPADAIVIAKAGAICKRIRARSTSLRFGTRQAIARSLSQFASYQRAALAELRKLVPSASLAHEWQEFEAAAHVLAADMTRAGEYAKAYHFAAVKPLASRIAADKVNMTTLAKHEAITGCERLY
jgi:hypothetical protein